MIGENYYYTLYNEDDGNYYYYDASEDIFYLYDAETYEELKDAYDDGMEEWYAVSARKSLRDALKDYEKQRNGHLGGVEIELPVVCLRALYLFVFIIDIFVDGLL